ncbi:MAG TPA: hypothetical protein VMJ10_20685 [Kofleriaceae bacterium]|nr:hypothetical protein [Kofleriaceae bacterium]
MTKTMMIAAILLTAAATAHAGGQAGSFGLGAEADLSGVAGIAGSYDAGKFHATALFGLATDAGGTNASEVDIAGLFFYHLHQTALADFGLGGGLDIASVPQMAAMGGTNRTTNVYLEPAFQIRLFVASNVALSFTSGINIGLSNGTNTVVIGQGTSLQGGAGVTYYFF